ncbi:hypothetical protein [Streptomyces boncukensis]|uniref:Chemotaxis protein n=1 Tax=Streptomyces boncukensis TaxID=2711219 RepID=A0A6G4WYA2_9ACTN|nr:hypothetical protein [Streptomyces boncukensis]NGO70215.1 hypothetical protein [Streptomyces boncukensis]
MRTTDLTDDVLAALRERRPYPAVTLTVPTHRTRPDNEQDPVRLRNRIGEAARRLDADPDVPDRVREAVVAQLETAEAVTDFVHALDSLVVFATADEHQIWYLPRTAAERVVISDTFLTRNLVAAKAQARPYWVLAFAEDRARLWSGSGDQLTEARQDGFPMEPAPLVDEDAARARLNRSSGTPAGYGDETTLQHLRAVDAALGRLLGRDPRPLALVGLAQGIAALKDVGTRAARTAVAAVPKGGLTDVTGHTLAQEVAPARAEVRRERTRGALERLDAARGRKLFIAGLDEVWGAAQEGRVALLVVEEPYRATVRITGGHLTPAEDGATGADVHEDIVDEVVEAALSTEAEVVFVPADALAGHGRIAAAVRYTWAAG